MRMQVTLGVFVCVLLGAACGTPGGDESSTLAEQAEATPAVGAERPRSGAPGEGSREAMVLAELNETCEENWCYGEFEYEFLALECGESTCELFFRAERDGEELEDSVEFDYDQPLVEDGYLEAGNWERVSDAISDWELAREAG